MGEANGRAVLDLDNPAPDRVDWDPAADQETVEGDAAHRADPGTPRRDAIICNCFAGREKFYETADADTGFMGILENADGTLEVIIFYQGQVIDNVTFSRNRIEGNLHGIIFDIVVDKLEREGHITNLLTVQ